MRIPVSFPLALLLASAGARADHPLPYDVRTRAYSGWSTTVRGDIRTVGMAGATVGLADTYLAATDNPAGLAMTMNTGDINFTRNWIYDSTVQDGLTPISGNSMGAALNSYPYGFALGYTSPFSEGHSYMVPDHPEDPTKLSVDTQEYQLSAARLFANDKLSLGLSLKLGQSDKRIAFNEPVRVDRRHSSYAFGATIGAMIQLPRRFILGASYSTPMHYPINVEESPTPRLENFFQNVESPSRIALGVGWIPNRFFRMDLSVFRFGPTDEAALLKDQTMIVGDDSTYQPRVGLAYNAVELKNVQATLFAGAYYETSRIEKTESRIHATAGLEAKVWILSMGWGIDSSAGYKNYLVSFGVNPFKVMQKLNLIPTPWQPPRGGLLPRPDVLKDEGLPRSLVSNWKQKGPDMNPVDIGVALPGKVMDRMISAPGDLRDSGMEMLEQIPDLPSTMHNKILEELELSAPAPKADEAD